MNNFQFNDQFVDRHIGISKQDYNEMLSLLGVKSLDELINLTLPDSIRLKKELQLDEPMSEFQFLKHLSEIASKNKLFTNYIGLGYYPTITPGVIVRNILENPGWYTSYTPYQAEISQGRLEALLNFQTVIADLTGLKIANASLLDEGTSAAEAMGMLYSLRKPNKKNANLFLVSDSVFPQTLDVMITRAEPLGIEIKVCDITEEELTDDVFGILVQYPDANGEVNDFKKLFEVANQKGIYKAVAADLLSLTLLTPPGEFGADIAVGSAQRFGVPMGLGGPHAAYFSTRDEFKRQIPGRIIGVSIDSQGRPALRMALQTREQHIKREHATSNICTAQALLAIMASMYAVYHGPIGLKEIALRINRLAQFLELNLTYLGYEQTNKYYFDTLKITLTSHEEMARLNMLSEEKSINLRRISETEIGISLDETKTIDDINILIGIFAELKGKETPNIEAVSLDGKTTIDLDSLFGRKTGYLTHPVFNSYYSETDMMRYIKSLEKKDLSLNTSMIPLGSCTMKLNAASEMFGITWKEFTDMHPFAPKNQSEGYQIIFKELEKQLAEITGFKGVSLQPNSGAQGEYTGLMVIRAYHKNNGDLNRNICLIPSSAHGTNPASAVMVGNKVVVVKCDNHGNVDINDLKEKAEQYKDTLSSLMITYPSTHGVFEKNIIDICDIIHQNGGLVYMDGANMNAQVGLTSPGFIGADVCHLNLHKTFTIPHGGGGPGVGPIGVNEKLLPFLPGHSLIKIGNEKAINAVSSAPYGSANVMLIPYAYIKMMGAKGLTEATKAAILNANYIKAKLEKEYKVLYAGENGFVAHELIFDLREFKATTGVEVEDVAKRLMDYGYHAPTVSFPVPGTLMVEPTESESLNELNKFCSVMLAIKKEIKEIEVGQYDKASNVLKNAPHTALAVIADEWKNSYSREKAIFPDNYTRENKFWPAVGRVNNAYGDRNLVCSCPPITDYVSNEE
ncbi:MAG: aminomethyl-transferring glycine dehydrogenase [Melioribacteraceae bacterium]|nr:aminomethyl-transferring glycine dehydrogenase [Melioribacteraceae bacterium]